MGRRALGCRVPYWINWIADRMDKRTECVFLQLYLSIACGREWNQKAKPKQIGVLYLEWLAQAKTIRLRIQEWSRELNGQ